jgi:hypothetical protein
MLHQVLASRATVKYQISALIPSSIKGKSREPRNSHGRIAGKRPDTDFVASTGDQAIARREDVHAKYAVVVGLERPFAIACRVYNLDGAIEEIPSCDGAECIRCESPLSSVQCFEGIGAKRPDHTFSICIYCADEARVCQCKVYRMTASSEGGLRKLVIEVEGYIVLVGRHCDASA